MRRVIATLAVTLAAAAAGVGSAFAGTPVQSSTQSATTDQAALAASSAVQIQPTNENLVVRVLSPGSDGAVTQTNDAASSATAGNTGTTTQNATQAQAAPCGCVSPTALIQAAQDGNIAGLIAAAAPLAQPAAAPAAAAPQQAPQTTAAAPAVQSSGQDAATDQQAAAASSATQVDPTNQNVSVRVLSPGSNGSVAQTNNAASSATSGNTATTGQTASQTQGGSGVQSSVQHAGTGQDSAALSAAKQIAPSNSNISVRVLSPGSDGNVSQTNNAASSATSGNTATTTQNATQNQGSSLCGCSGSGSGVQSSDQSAHTDQGSLAASKAVQLAPSNSNNPIRIGSWGDNGSVNQTNDAASSATSGNTATTGQTAGQTQGGSG